MLPGTSPRDPQLRRAVSTQLARGASDGSAGHGNDSQEDTASYGVFVAKPNAWEVCDTAGVLPPRPAAAGEKNSFMVSVHPRDDVRIIERVGNTRELILSVPVAAAPLLKRPTGETDATSSVLVELPGSDDTCILSEQKFPDECVAVVCRVQGRLLRNSCDTDFDCQTHSVLQCGIAVNISRIRRVWLTKSSFTSA